MKAFPHTKYFSEQHDNDHINGMDLRDYFAAKAMQAFANAWALNKDYPDTDSEVALLSYQLADAMMKQRKELK